MFFMTGPQKKAEYWLAKLESPDLTTEGERAFFDWLEASPQNQLAYLRAEELWHKGSMTGFSLNPNSHASGFNLFSFKPVMTFACTVLFFVGGLFLFSGQEQQAPQQFATQVGEQAKHQLADGSTVVLNTNSKLTVALLKDRRVATLEAGEVLFNISADKDRPFDVVTDTGRVRVVGTQFIVRKQHDASLVTVIEGKVGLIAEKHSDMPQQLLVANQQAVLSPAQIHNKPKQVDASAYAAWQRKQLVYQGTTLAEVVADLNRYYDQKFVIDNELLAQTEVSAVLQIKDAPTTARALAAALGLSVELSASGDTVKLVQAK